MWTTDLSTHFITFAANATESLYIYCPFIQADVLEKVIGGTKARDIIVVTTWNTEDIFRGFSDPRIYPLLKARGAYLYIHKHLHLKVLVTDLSAITISTANLTKKALGLATPSNIECATTIGRITTEEQLWFLKIIFDSLLVQDDYYSALQAHLSIHQPSSTPPLVPFDDSNFLAKRFFLKSSLPMSTTPDTLMSNITAIQERRESSVDSLELRCALHDVALYGLSLSADSQSNRKHLCGSFFGHPFISALDAFIKDRRYFGEVKEWIQNNCADVPLPRRRQLTDNVRVLFDWFVSLGQGLYSTARPNYSQCLVREESPLTRK